MPQEKKRRVTRKAPRTQIEELSPHVEELSEEEATLESGGLVYVTPRNVSLWSPGIRTDSTATSI